VPCSYTSFYTKPVCRAGRHLLVNRIGSWLIDHEYPSDLVNLFTSEGQEEAINLTVASMGRCIMRYPIIFVLILLPGLTLAETRREMKDLQLPSQGIDTLVIKCGAGSLNLRGIDGHSKIQVVSQILVDGLEGEDLDTFFRKNLLLHLEQQGTKAVLRSVFVRPTHINPREAKIDTTLRVPRNLNVKIDDNSGPISVNDLSGDLEVDDGSGSIKIKGKCFR
jgi:hypothetical protein